MPVSNKFSSKFSAPFAWDREELIPKAFVTSALEVVLDATAARCTVEPDIARSKRQGNPVKIIAKQLTSPVKRSA